MPDLGSGVALGFGNFSDGGIAFGPGGVLFYTEYPGNSIGEVIPPNYSADFKTVALTPLGVGASVGALNFVPAGFNGAGQFKVVSHDTNGFYTIPLTPDGSGGYDLGNATLAATLIRGTIQFVKPVSAQIGAWDSHSRRGRAYLYDSACSS